MHCGTSLSAAPQLVSEANCQVFLIQKITAKKKKKKLNDNFSMKRYKWNWKRCYLKNVIKIQQKVGIVIVICGYHSSTGSTAAQHWDQDKYDSDFHYYHNHGEYYNQKVWW